MTARIIHGDCIEAMRELPVDSIDAIVTDPPYGLEFMGKGWDAPWKRGDDINTDAGLTGTGYTDGGNRLPRPTFTGSTNPKCLVCRGTRRGRRDGTAKVAVCLCADGGKFPNVRAAEMLAFQEWCNLWTTECLRVLKPGGHLLAFGGTRTWHRLACAIEDAGFEMRDSIAWMYGSGFPKSLDVSKAIDKAAGAAREVVGTRTSGQTAGMQALGPSGIKGGDYDITAPATEAAQQWQGWGTALKPAFEPICVARKPLVGTVAANVLAYGTGALNIDGSRIGTEGGGWNGLTAAGGTWNAETTGLRKTGEPSAPAGRWPANVVLDESQAEALDEQTAHLTGGGASRFFYCAREDEPCGSEGIGTTGNCSDTAAQDGVSTGVAPVAIETLGSRFMYVAKAPKSERPVVDGVAHATVKPLALMRWLVRLVTPPGGTVLDPFGGSGTTVEAAMLEGFDVIAIERGGPPGTPESKYLAMIELRIQRATAALASIAARPQAEPDLFTDLP